MMTDKGYPGEHPALADFLEHHRCDRARAELGLRVLLNLAEVRGWRDVDLHFCEELQAPFVVGRPTLSNTLQAAFPMAMEESMSHQQIQQLFSSLLVDDKPFQSVMLAICASDTSMVYYRVSNDIVKPEHPDASEARKQDWQQRSTKRRLLVAESIETFSKHTLLQQADGGPT